MKKSIERGWFNSAGALSLMSFILISLLGSNPAEAQKRGSTASQATQRQATGDVIGTVSDCDGPIADAVVYIPGKSWDARTDANGRFQIAYVQPGSYTLVAAAADGTRYGQLEDVEIQQSRTTDIQQGLNLCLVQDRDGDGIFVPEDCDDTRADVYPGASEVCDAVDNDCDGEVDEGGACGEPHSCTDGLFNGHETDIDCGGPDCTACAIGRACMVDADCESGICDDGVCR